MLHSACLMDAGVPVIAMARSEVMTRQHLMSMRLGLTEKRDVFLLWLLAGLLSWQAAVLPMAFTCAPGSVKRTCRMFAPH